MSARNCSASDFFVSDQIRWSIVLFRTMKTKMCHIIILSGQFSGLALTVTVSNQLLVSHVTVLTKEANKLLNLENEY